ncbi:GGDEF domain-containing protein [Streptomyces sp. NRRL S-146]|uniref:GGDEF domain-containing protein n=1 Tax=Streptomyces sp. NRRL S-146 TaxID=1463884 RepID=UPI00068CFECF|nr:GGDEF domain-containing protein [Streptomyces sp. NRRL S-146]
MTTSTAVRAVIDPASALVAARAEIENGAPSVGVLAQLAQLSEVLLGQVENLAEQLTEARTCPVTQLPTRAAWNALAEEVCASGSAVVLLIDLNDFKPVNDAHGHAAGDAVLAATGERLRTWANGRGYAGRLGGDEFVVVVQDEPRLAAAISDLRDRLHASISHGGTRLSVGAAIGVATVPGNTPEALSRAMSKADRRMYRDKGRPGRR